MSEIKQTELISLKTEETNDFVLNVFSKVDRLITQEIMNLRPNQRFIIKGRIICLIFAMFYNPVISEAQKDIMETEKCQK